MRHGAGLPLQPRDRRGQVRSERVPAPSRRRLRPSPTSRDRASSWAAACVYQSTLPGRAPPTNGGSTKSPSIGARRGRGRAHRTARGRSASDRRRTRRARRAWPATAPRSVSHSCPCGAFAAAPGRIGFDHSTARREAGVEADRVDAIAAAVRGRRHVVERAEHRRPVAAVVPRGRHRRQQRDDADRPSAAPGMRARRQSFERRHRGVGDHRQQRQRVARRHGLVKQQVEDRVGHERNRSARPRPGSSARQCAARRPPPARRPRCRATSPTARRTVFEQRVQHVAGAMVRPEIDDAAAEIGVGLEARARARYAGNAAARDDQRNGPRDRAERRRGRPIAPRPRGRPGAATTRRAGTATVSTGVCERMPIASPARRAPTSDRRARRAGHQRQGPHRRPRSPACR